MRKSFHICAFWFFAAAATFAQDKIVLQDWSVIDAKVVKVGDEEVEYKKPENPSGPTYGISKRRIRVISYANGTRDHFEDQAVAPAPTPYASPTVAAPEPQNISESNGAETHGILGVGYINYLNGGFGMSLHGGSFTSGSLGFLAAGYLASSSYTDVYAEYEASMDGFALGPTVGLTDNFYLYGICGILVSTLDYTVYSSDFSIYESDVVESSYFLAEFGGGLILGYVGVHAGLNLLDFDFGSSRFNIAASISW